MENGKLLIFSAPSGSGKTTIVRQLLENNPNLGFSISAATRAKRGEEVHGKDYYFLSPDEFRTKIEENAFAEWEEVYTDTYYGTLKSEIERLWASGKHVIFDVDVKGGISLKQYYGDKALAIFVKVPSLEEVERRLRDRGTDSEESIMKRIAKMEYEMSFQEQFDRVLINDQLEVAVQTAQEWFEELIG